MEDTRALAVVHYAGYTRSLARQSVGRGWTHLVDKVFDALEDLTSGSRELIPTPKIIQVKEKWGGLRIYTSGDGTHPIEDVIREVENESYNVCEDCGNLGQLRNLNGLYKTTCEEHSGGYPPIKSATRDDY